MKIQKLFLSILAAASLFAGCKEPEPEPTIPSLTVGQTELSFEQGGGTGNITVTSNRPWTISTDADWLAFNPSSGNAADAPVTVTVTALANSSTDRTASFKVKTDFDFRTVEVSQKGAKGEDPNVTPSGSGTAADPYNVAATDVVRFAGGATAARMGKLSASDCSRVLAGDITIAADFDVIDASADYWCVTNASRFTAGKLKKNDASGNVNGTPNFRICEGGYAHFTSVDSGRDRLKLSVQGELEVDDYYDTKSVQIVKGTDTGKTFDGDIVVRIVLQDLVKVFHGMLLVIMLF